MFDDEPVFESVPEEKAETFLFIYLCRAEEKINECVLREVCPHGFLIYREPDG
jgi:hypothetical protein